MPIPSNCSKRVKIFHESHNESSGGAVYCTGTGDMGQLGLGEDILKAKKPIKVPNVPTNCVQVCAGGVHSACLTSDGKVFTWGCNDDGALGRRTEANEDDVKNNVKIYDEYEAGQVKGLIEHLKIVQLSAGDSHTAALTDDGIVYIWGTFRNANGRIGLVKEKRTEREPIRLKLKSRDRPVVVKIASGNDHLCCLCSDGRLFTFGNWEQGQLGRNIVDEMYINDDSKDEEDDKLVDGCNETVDDSYFHQLDTMEEPENSLELYLQPVAVLLTNYVKFDDCWAGAFSTFARAKKSKHIYACGLNNYKQLNIDPKIDDRSNNENLLIRDLTQWKGIPSSTSTSLFQLNSFQKSSNAQLIVNNISCGEHHTLVGCTNGAQYSLGRHDYGRLGLGDQKRDDAQVPEMSPLFDGINKKLFKLATGPATSLAISSDFKLYGWGMCDNYQLPIPTKTDLYTPTYIPINGQVLDCSVGAQHALIIIKDC